jgi:AbrB family looped-hinge helix DNA binding protein
MKKYPKLVQCDARGQIVIPKDVRRELHIEEGTGFYMYTITDEGILLKKVAQKELADHKEILTELQENGGKIGIEKKALDTSVKKYRKDKEGGLDII